jgi:hypothetical protein
MHQAVVGGGILLSVWKVGFLKEKKLLNCETLVAAILA